jgi:hypothetical protein
MNNKIANSLATKTVPQRGKAPRNTCKKAQKQAKQKSLSSNAHPPSKRSCVTIDEVKDGDADHSSTHTPSMSTITSESTGISQTSKVCQ